MKNTAIYQSKSLFSRNFILICACNFCTCLASYTLMPVLPLYLIDALNCPKDVMGAALSIYTFMALVSRPVSGLVSDIFNLKYVCMLATLCCAVLFPVLFFAATVFLFICGRFAQGIAFSIMSTATSTIGVNFIPSAKMGAGIGILSSAMPLAMITGPLIGLWAVETLSYGAAFWIAFCFCAAGAILLIFIDPIVRPAAGGNSHISVDSFFMLKGTFTLISLTLAAFMHGMIINYISVLARENGIPEYTSIFFLIMGCGFLFSRLVCGYFSDKGYMIVQICVTEIVTFLVSLWLASVTIPAAFLTCAGLLGLSLGSLSPAYQTILVTLADKSKLGTANSMYYMGMDGGIFAALLAGGVIAEYAGMKMAFTVGALAQIIALANFIYFVAPKYKVARLSKSK